MKRKHSKETIKKIKRTIKERRNYKGKNHPLYRYDLPNKKIIRMYKAGFSAPRIISKLNLDCDHHLIYRRLKETGIKIRKKKEYNVNKETRKKQREAKLKNPIKYWLGKKRREETNDKISNTLKKAYKEGRIDSPFKKGKKHIYFNNWSSKEPYGILFFKRRPAILSLFNNRCALTGSRKYIEVHHIDEDKKNNSFCNMIPLEKGMHSRIGRLGAEKFKEELKGILYNKLIEVTENESNIKKD